MAVALGVLQCPGDIGQRRQIGAVTGDDPARDARKIDIAVIQMRNMSAQFIDDRLKTSRIKHGQGIGGCGSSQTRKIQSAIEIGLVLQGSKRTCHRIEKGEKKSEEQLIDTKDSVAMRRQSAQAKQMSTDQTIAICQATENVSMVLGQRLIEIEWHQRHAGSVPSIGSSRKTDSCGVTRTEIPD